MEGEIINERDRLKPGQTIRLSSYIDGSNAKNYQILSVIGEGASAVCYEAIRIGEEGKRTDITYASEEKACGILKEFYPVSTRSGERTWTYSMKRLGSGQLIPCGNTVLDFERLCEEYIEAYRTLERSVHPGKDGDTGNRILNNYIQGGQVLYGCPDVAGNEACRPTVYIWSRELHGISFEQYLDEVREHPLERPDETLLGILETVHAVADCVKAIHEAGLVHLDIKPSNFLVLYDSFHRILPNCISLFDIDTMHPVGDDFPVKGTEGYAAPEVRRGEAALCWADIYSIGAMLFRAVVISGSDGPETQDGLYHDGYYKNLGFYVKHSALIRGSRSNSDVRLMSLLVRILQGCLAPYWEERYESCEPLLSDLERAIGRLRLYAMPAGALRSDEQVSVTVKEVDVELVMQKLLYQLPVQENVLVVGAGSVGQSYMDQCLQAGQSRDTVLNIQVLSEMPAEDADTYLRFRAALTDFVSVTAEGKPVTGAENCYARISFDSLCLERKTSSYKVPGCNNSREALQKQVDWSLRYDCIFVALGEDALNRKIAEMIAEEMANRKMSNIPVCYACEELIAKEYANIECYPLYQVWVNEPVTSDTIHSQLNRMAFQAHLCWDSTPNRDIHAIYKKFAEDTYNYASSTSFALSIQSKLHSIGIEVETENEEGLRLAASQFQEQILDQLHPGQREEEKTDTEKEAERKFAILAALEHRRWLMEKTADGWTAPNYKNTSSKYQDCIVRGSVRDDSNHTHPCMVRSTEEMPLGTGEYIRNHHEKWDYPEAADWKRLDPLDRMSLELHRCFAAYTADFKRKASFSDADMEAIRNLVPSQDGAAVHALRQFEYCLKNILNGSEHASREYSHFEQQFLRSIQRMDKKSIREIEDRVSLIRKAYFPVKESNLYRDYKAIDAALIRKLPFILTGRFPVESLAVSFADVSTRDERKECLIANIASVDILSPEKIFYVKYLRNKMEAEAFLQDWENVFAYLDRRGIYRWIYLLLAIPKETGEEEKVRNFVLEDRERSLYEHLSQNLAAFARERQWKVQKSVEFTGYEMWECESEAAAAEWFAGRLVENKVGLLDDSVYVFETTEASEVPDANERLEGMLAEKEIGIFRFDRRRNRFTDCRGCPDLLYVEDNSYIRIEDYHALIGETGWKYEFPEFENDSDVLWGIYTGENMAGKPFRSNEAVLKETDLKETDLKGISHPDETDGNVAGTVRSQVYKQELGDRTAQKIWEALCERLSDYERNRPALAVLRNPEGEQRKNREKIERHTCFLPDYTCRTVERLLSGLRNYGIIADGSQVSRYASDTCQLTVICEADIWRELSVVFNQPQLLIDYYGVMVEPSAETDCEVRIVGNLLDVAGLELGCRNKDMEAETNCLSSDMEMELAAQSRNILEQLRDAGYIAGLHTNREMPDVVSFAYSSLRIKELLTTKGSLQAVHWYYDILKNSSADDVRYMKPSDLSERSSSKPSPIVLYSKGYQIFHPVTV